MNSSLPPPSINTSYTIAILAPTSTNHLALREMLTTIHPPIPQHPQDHNTYTLGCIGAHYVAIFSLSTGHAGKIEAAVRATECRYTFPNIKACLVVGTAGGVPRTADGTSMGEDVRLGDVVVSMPSGVYGGLVEYDTGKSLAGGEFLRTGFLNGPPIRLLTAIQDLRADHIIDGKRKVMRGFHDAYRLAIGADGERPQVEDDILFHAAFLHTQEDANHCESCKEQGLQQICTRKPRRWPDVPKIHYGTVASGSTMMADAVRRDSLSASLGGVLAFEMESAGLANHFPCISIRGVANYADSHKYASDKLWKKYASGIAAAYARELLDHVSEYVLPEDRQPVIIKEPCQNKCCLMDDKENRAEEIHMSGVWINNSRVRLQDQDKKEKYGRIELDVKQSIGNDCRSAPLVQPSKPWQWDSVGVK